MQHSKKFAPYDICFFICIILALPFLVWKCRFGYGAADEPFYLTLAHRLSQGDALLSEEWNLAQLSGFLLLPFYKLHDIIVGSTEGIILHFRYIYVAVQTIVCILLYLNLRKFKYGALCAVLLFYLYTPYDIMALSYNTMGLMSITLCLCLVISGHTLWAGFCYAIAVLCNPFLITIYLLYGIIYGIALILTKFTKLSTLSFTTKNIVFFTLGAAIPAFLLFVFALSRAGISEILDNLKCILNDPEHASRSLFAVIHSYAYVMLSAFKNYLIAFAIVLFIALSDRNKYRNAWLYFCMTALLSAIAVLMHLPDIQTDYNRIMFPLVTCGLTSYLLTQHKNHKIFCSLWVTGILYTFCLSWASNQGENSICMGMPVAMVGSVLLIWNFLLELRAKPTLQKEHVSSKFNSLSFTTPLTYCIAILLFLAQFGTQCYAKSVHAFWEPSVSELTTTLKGGPLDGVITTKEHADAYDTLRMELSAYDATKENHNEPVLFITASPWCYLYANRPYGTYSSWISSTYSSKAPIEVLRNRLTEYYLLHPDRIPSHVYIAKNEQWDYSFLSKLSENQGYQLFDNDPLSSYIDVYSVHETEHGYHLTRID